MKYIVTLVHGTFGRRAKWANEDSPFCNELRRRLGGSGVLVHSFRWTGRLSVRARDQGALELGLALRRRLDEDPTARHVVIGHSHGGTIAVQAVMDDPVLTAAVSVVCLSTPFLYVRLYSSAETGPEFVVLLAFSWAMTMASMFVGYRMGHRSAAILLLICSLALLLTGNRIAGIALRALRSRAERLEHAVNRILPRDIKLLLVRSAADEASAGLAIGQFLFFIVGCVMAPLLWLLFYGTLAFGVIGAVGGAVLFLGAEGVSIAITRIAFIVWGVTFLMLAGIVTLAALTAISSLPYAPELILASRFLQPSVEAIPPGAWTLHRLTSAGAEQHPRRRWMHSSYEDPQVVELVASWLGEP